MNKLKQWCKRRKISGTKLASILNIPYNSVKLMMNNEETRMFPIYVTHLFTGISIEHLLPIDCRHEIKRVKNLLEQRPKTLQIYNNKKLDISGISYPRFSQFTQLHIDQDIVHIKSVQGDEHYLNLSTYKRYFKESPKNRMNDFIELAEQEENLDL